MLDKEELKHIADAINAYCRKNDCRIELEEIDITTYGDRKPRYLYKLAAIKEEQIKC